ncbi:MAG TPA: class I SAM-dependent methyltransferase [Chloroflexia bacterium]|nr:class I SAM-dependent methyltransferase [Chloroflexia bacterium]
MTKDELRLIAKQLARQYIAENNPTGWFEVVYARAGGDEKTISWADMEPNPFLLEWLEREKPSGTDQSALVVGCGLGDDAEALARLGFKVTAFDISPTAVEWCKRRFPDSKVNYAVADLLALPSEWAKSFDLVVEIYTLQVLPPDLRRQAMKALADCLSSEGLLLVICRGREEEDDPGSMPWPLSRQVLEEFQEEGLTELSFVDFMDKEEPPTRRFRAVYKALK